MKRKLLLICLILAELLTAAFGAVGLFMCFRDSGAKILIYYTTDSNVLGVAASLLCAGLALRALISGGDIPRPALMFRLAAAWEPSVQYLETRVGDLARSIFRMMLDEWSAAISAKFS